MLLNVDQTSVNLYTVTTQASSGFYIYVLIRHGLPCSFPSTQAYGSPQVAHTPVDDNMPAGWSSAMDYSSGALK